jgi:hypothetical protein
MKGEVFATLSKHAGLILFCAQALNEGRSEAAMVYAEKLSDSEIPLARAIVGRVLAQAGENEKAWKKFVEAMNLASGRKSSTSRYIVEYCKCFVLEWKDKQYLKEQITKALSIEPPPHVLECLPLFDDIEIFD